MSRQVVMRRRILELLAHPRQIAMATVDLSECPHSGVLEPWTPPVVSARKTTNATGLIPRMSSMAWRTRKWSICIAH